MSRRRRLHDAAVLKETEGNNKMKTFLMAMLLAVCSALGAWADEVVRWYDSAQKVTWGYILSNGEATIARTTGIGKNKKTVSATAVVAWNGDDYGPYAVFLVDGKILEVSWSFVPSTPLWQNTNGEGQ